MVSAATAAEVNAGTVTNKYVSPATLVSYFADVKANNKTWRSLGSFSPKSSNAATITINDDWANYDMIVISGYGLANVSGSNSSSLISTQLFGMQIGSHTVPSTSLMDTMRLVLGRVNSSVTFPTLVNATVLFHPSQRGGQLTAFVMTVNRTSIDSNENVIISFVKTWSISSYPRDLTVDASQITTGTITIYGCNF